MSEYDRKNKYIIYMIERNDDGMQYVGLTRRELAARVGSHSTEAMSKGVHEGGLAVAIRDIRENGYKLSDCFSVSILEEFHDGRDYALSREKYWVDYLNTRYPNGFNIFPGGSSAGAIDNGIPITLVVDGQEEHFDAISEAVAWVNTALQNENISDATVRRRLADGWSNDEAFGLTEHVDQRTIRETFLYNGNEYNSLRSVSDMVNVPIDTLKSRLQRAKDNNIDNYDISMKHSVTRNESSLLPHPFDENLDGISSRVFQTLTNISQTTISRRAKLYRKRCEKEMQTRDGLLTCLLSGENRSNIIDLILPNGAFFSGSINKLAKKVTEDIELQPYRKSYIKYSTVRKKLQRLFIAIEHPGQQDIWDAVGLKGESN